MKFLSWGHATLSHLMGDRKRPLLRPAALVLLTPLLSGGVAGTYWGVNRVQTQVIPQLAQELSQSLNRPVQLGKIQRVSLTTIRLGKSIIPATPTDRDTVTIEAVEIHFNPVKILREKAVRITVKLIRPEIVLDQNASGDWLTSTITLTGDSSVDVEQVQFQNATLTLLPYHMSGNSQQQTPPPMEWRRINATVALGEESLGAPSEPTRFTLTGYTPQRGTLHLEGQIHPQSDQVALQIIGKQVAIAPLSPFLPPEIHLQAGYVDVDLAVHLQPNQAPHLQGTATLHNLAARADGEPNPFTDTQGTLHFDGQTIALEKGFIRFGQIPFHVQGTIDLQQGLDLTAQVESVSAADFMQTFQLTLPFPVEGALRSDNVRVQGPFDHVVFSGIVHEAAPIHVDRLEFATARTEFVLDKTTDRLSLIGLEFVPSQGGRFTTDAEILLKDEGSDVQLTAGITDVSVDAIAKLYNLPNVENTLGNLQATATVTVSQDNPHVMMDWKVTDGEYPVEGRVVLQDDILTLQQAQLQIGGGQIYAQGQLRDQQWQMQVEAIALPLTPITASLPGELSGQWDLAGTTNLDLNTLNSHGQAQIHLDTGVIQATTAVEQGRWQAHLNGSDIPLNQFSSEWTGKGTGEMVLTGSLNSFDLKTLRADGQVYLSEGVPFFPAPITAQVKWDGDRLLPHITAAGLQVEGWVAAQMGTHGTPTLTDMVLDIQLQNYDLTALPLALPEAVQPTGFVNFVGQWQGTPSRPVLQGQLGVNQLSVAGFAFDPRLQGTVQFNSTQGLQLNLAGERDRIAGRLNPEMKAATLSVGREAMQIAGEWTDDRLSAHLNALPLETFTPLLPDAFSDLPLRGLLSGQVKMDWSEPSNPSVVAEMEVLRPTWGTLPPDQEERHEGDRLTAQVRYADEIVSLINGDLTFGHSHYRLDGQYDLSGRAPLTAHVITEESDLQDVVTALHWFKAGSDDELIVSALPSFVDPLAVPVGLSIDPALLNITALQGKFSGAVTLQRSPHSDLSVDFNLSGQNWTLGRYRLDQVTIQGSQTPNQPLTLLPISLIGLAYESKEGDAQPFSAEVTFSGTLDEQASMGEIRIQDIPLSFLQAAFDLPVSMVGRLDAIATLQGSLGNPELVGSFALEEAQVQGVEIGEVELGFQYSDAQFNLNRWSESITSPDQNELP